MKTIIQEQGKQVIVTLEGYLDAPSTTGVEMQMAHIFDIKNGEIIIDCTNLEYISSSGLRLFLSIKKQCVSNNSKLKMKSVNSFVREVFLASGFIQIFEIVD